MRVVFSGACCFGKTFADAIRILADPTSATKRIKTRLEGKSFAVPDSVLMAARDSNAMETSLDARQMAVSAVSTKPKIKLTDPQLSADKWCGVNCRRYDRFCGDWTSSRTNVGHQA